MTKFLFKFRIICYDRNYDKKGGVVLKIICGFFMALADSVPGVSGGTIAFLLGQYDNFINSLNNIVAGTMKQRKRAARFLIQLMLGWIVGFILAVIVLTAVFEEHIYQISSLFLGFIIFSIPIVTREERKSFLGHGKNIVYMLMGIALVVLITYFNPANGDGKAVDLMNLSFGTGLYLFVAAMIAISAMVLPGISGSTLLLIFGLYVPVMNCIKNVLSFDLKSLPPVMIFGFGVLVGIVTIVRLVKIALQKFRSQTVYTILGLMIGSLYAIVMGPTTLDTPQKAMTISTFSIVFFVIGGALIGGLQMLKKLQFDS